MAIRVLVVDDVMTDREALKRILQGNGYAVAGEASDGEQAVAAFRTLRPDLLLLDLVLPRLSGIEAAQAILKEDPAARIIAVCGLAHPSVQGEAVRAGLRGFVSKPVKVDVLLPEIEDVLS